MHKITHTHTDTHIYIVMKTYFLDFKIRQLNDVNQLNDHIQCTLNTVHVILKL